MNCPKVEHILTKSKVCSRTGTIRSNQVDKQKNKRQTVKMLPYRREICELVQTWLYAGNPELVEGDQQERLVNFIEEKSSTSDKGSCQDSRVLIATPWSDGVGRSKKR